MKRPASYFGILAVSLFLFTAGVSAEPSPQRTVTTTGEGLATAPADMATIQLQTSTVNKSASAAKQTVDQHINNAIQALNKLGIDRNDLVASTLRLTPDYQYNNREQIFSGYQASRDLSVTLKNLGALDKVLEAATAAGINNILTISLKTSKEEALQEQAFQLAIADSKKKAGILARAYGAELGNIHTINYHNSSPIFVQESSPMMAKASMDQGGGQYLHDKIRVQDQVQVVFELIIPH